MSDELRKQVSNKLTGVKKSLKTREKMSESKIGKKLTCSTKEKIKNSAKHRPLCSTESKNKMSIAAKSRVNNTKNTVWITNGIINKRVYQILVLENGWHFGRCGKTNQHT
jgi:poly-D-alanine transfer protein DltD